MANQSQRIVSEYPMFAQLVYEELKSGRRRYGIHLVERDDPKKSYSFIRSRAHLQQLPNITDLFDDLERDCASRRMVPVLVSGILTDQEVHFRGRFHTLSSLTCTALKLDDGREIPDFD